MSAEQTELFDKAILKVLDANRTSYGLTLAAIGHLTVQFGFPNPDKDELQERVDYLVNKNLVEEKSKLIGRANRAWRITAAGITFIDENP